MTADIAYLQTLQEPLQALDRQFNAQRAAYAANPMPPAAQRQQWLKALRDLLSNERQALIEAISADFSHRSADETLLDEIKDYYDGFSFDGVNRLYNPFSTLSFLKIKGFKNFWFESGSPSFLVNYVKNMI